MPTARALTAFAGLQAMARPYTRTLNGQAYRWNITHIELRGENTIVVKAKVHLGTNQQGPVVLDSATDPVFDELWFVEPLTLVEDGEEPNPNHDPADPMSRPTRTKWKQDAIEAMRVMLDRELMKKLGNA